MSNSSYLMKSKSLQSKLETLKNLFVYLQKNKVEFLMKVQDIAPELKAKGYFICQLDIYQDIKKPDIGMKFEKLKNILNNDMNNDKSGILKDDVEYDIHVLGFLSYDKNLKAEEKKKVIGWLNWSVALYLFDPKNINVNAIEQQLDLNPVLNGVKQSQKYENIVIRKEEDNITADPVEIAKSLPKSPFDQKKFEEVFHEVFYNGYPILDFENFQLKLDDGVIVYLYYYKKPWSIQKQYFNSCNDERISSNKNFKFVFDRESLLYTDAKQQKIINLNKLKTANKFDLLDQTENQQELNKIQDDNKNEVLSIINSFVDKDIPNDKKHLLFISHNIQNKNGKENSQKDTEGVEGVGIANIFRQYSEMLFGQNLKNPTPEEAFKFTQSMVILLQETNWKAIDETIYGEGDVHYVNCDIANGSLFLYRKNVYGYNTFRHLENVNGIYKYINVDSIDLQNMNVINGLLTDCKKLYDDYILSEQKGGNPTTPSQRKRARSSISNTLTSPKPKKQRPGTIEKYDYMIQYITRFKNELQKLETAGPNKKLIFKTLQMKYMIFFEYLKKYSSVDIQNNNLNKEKKELFLNAIFLQPQFKMKYLNFEKNIFNGQIMVHDLTDYFEKGLTETKGSREYVYGQIKLTNNQKLYAISCDERMNFTNSISREDSKNNKTKQLCTIFSSKFFDPLDPLRNTDETHVLLIGIGVTGPTKNHVALVVANNTFEEVIINVHLESGGQGSEVGSNEYALAELDVLLNNILGNNIHPFFRKHKDTIKNIRIFSDFNLLSNVIAEQLKNFKIKKEFKDFRFNLLLDRIKTHDNVGRTDKSFKTSKLNPKKQNSGCIDNVIYISKIKDVKNTISNVIIGHRKLPDEDYTKEKYDSLSDHSPVIIIEDHDTQQLPNSVKDSIDVIDLNFLDQEVKILTSQLNATKSRKTEAQRAALQSYQSYSQMVPNQSRTEARPATSHSQMVRNQSSKAPSQSRTYKMPRSEASTAFLQSNNGK